MNTRTKKRIAIGAGLIILAWLLFFDLRVYQLNNVLQDDSEISNYPYTFSVESFDNGVVTISSPRSGKVSATSVLRAMSSELRYEDDDSEKMVAAQKELARIQLKVAKLITEQDDVTQVKWELDEFWLRNHGIQVF
ncbi:hypothetical protein KJ365_04155 [Glaciecola sp. XM2]|jgi:hypothetical protein|uniref:hypothetical protein n=1 Tax=Glaciecola sp. XM2 TaxID=1914931 RepID=UPI001BDF1755|nr:hypothetical protein [Glaciecola sp. XM2]MBT1450062.1 hypothetical protein [Glaciecola sp. XM2]